uniref:E3 ubiquitin-protein ligase RNF182 n=1 Tax=Monopterus albus TaxID=43700 RepID=A0A3Q3KF38_MONAL
LPCSQPAMIEQQSTDDGSSGGHTDVLSAEKLECKICYCTYNLGSRRPKALECCHHLCAKCFAKILNLGESPPSAVVCPFCRCVTRLSREALSNLPDDINLVAVLAFQTSSSTTYSSLPGSPNFVVITIMEPSSASTQDLHLHHQSHESHASNQGFRSSSLDSMELITQRWTVLNCAALLSQTLARALVWVLGLLYFSSLPMGVYLLMIQRTTLGVMLVSLVPASLVMVMVYGFFLCICHECCSSRININAGVLY